ncbi:hypothetical protein CCP3SC1AL1_320022 [Gammaproteobacteria bacterium]
MFLTGIKELSLIKNSLKRVERERKDIETIEYCIESNFIYL